MGDEKEVSNLVMTLLLMLRKAMVIDIMLELVRKVI